MARSVALGAAESAVGQAAINDPAVVTTAASPRSDNLDVSAGGTRLLAAGLKVLRN